MTALILTMTTAGLGRYSAAQTDTGVDLTITQVGLSSANFVAAPTLTALPGEFRRVATVSGEALAGNLVHMTVQDDADITYSVRGFGLFLGDGTLFATYSQAPVLVEKSVGSMLALAIDIAFPQANVAQIRFGDTSFLNPPATVDKKGVVQLATLAQANAGDTTRVTTGSIVKSMIAAALEMVTQALKGLEGRTVFGSGLVKGGGDATTNRTLTVDAASPADVAAGTRGDMALTPAGLASLAATIGTGEFQLLPGVFIKTGLKAGPHNEGSVAIDFATAFPSECLAAVPIAVNSSGNYQCDTHVQEQALTRSTFTVYVQKMARDSANLDAIRWIAIGR